jgi:Xaa-Pro dipeptidase
MPSRPTDAPNPLAAVDFERLRRDRLARCFETMQRSGVDVLVLGREANVRYASDARRLWLAGTRPFGPGCIVVAATREVHLLSTSDEGVPAAIPVANLYPLTWNPDVLAARLARIPGLREARRVGIDGWNAAGARLLAAVAPDAGRVDGAALMHEVRRRKSADEIACLRAALAVAAAGVDAVVEALRPGVDEVELRGVFAERVAALGATIPSLEGRFRASGAKRTERAGGNDAGRLAPGDLVVLRAGVMLAGYEGTLARTQPCSGPDAAPPASAAELAERAQRLSKALARACRAGATARDLLDAYASCGEPLPSGPIAHGIGLGSEPPMVGERHSCNGQERLDTGMVLSLRAAVASAAASYEVEDVVLVGDEGREFLTDSPRALDRARA